MFFTEGDKKRMLSKYDSRPKTDADKMKEAYLKKAGLTKKKKKMTPVQTVKKRAKSYYKNIGIKSSNSAFFRF